MLARLVVPRGRLNSRPAVRQYWNTLLSESEHPSGADWRRSRSRCTLASACSSIRCDADTPCNPITKQPRTVSYWRVHCSHVERMASRRFVSAGPANIPMSSVTPCKLVSEQLKFPRHAVELPFTSTRSGASSASCVVTSGRGGDGGARGSLSTGWHGCFALTTRKFFWVGGDGSTVSLYGRVRW